MYQLSKPTQELIKKYEDWNRSSEPKENTSTIHVDEVASKLAVFYEKIRGIIDWKEEHLLRTGAIERTLKRKIFSKLNINTGNFSNENVAEPFVFELIRGGIFPNDKIEESKIQAIQKILDKYIHMINNSPQDMPRIRLCNWILSIAACEIEEAMGESEKENALIDFMFQFLKEKIAIKGMSEKAALSGEEINIQLYIATQRALFKLDSPAISYRLIKYKYKDWGNIAEDKILLISKDIYAVQEKIEKDLNHPLADKFYKVCEKYDAPFLLLGDIISENQKEIREKLSDPKTLEILARKAYALRLKGLSRRLKRAAIYATISIFVTKILLALAVEIPLDKYIFGNFNFLAIGIDALFPPLLMFILIATIKPPREGNFNVLLLELIKIVFLQKNDFYEIKIGKRKNAFLVFFAKILYIVSFFISLGLIIYLLNKLDFPIISYFIFIIFVSLIAFTGTKLRQRAKELNILDEKEGFASALLDIFTLPLVQLGNWLASRWKKYNFIAAAFNILIDMPFSVFIELIEQWRYFLKEKKEKIH